MEFFELLELILRFGIIPVRIIRILRTNSRNLNNSMKIIRILRIDSRILRIPTLPETELPGNPGQARIFQ